MELGPVPTAPLGAHQPAGMDHSSATMKLFLESKAPQHNNDSNVHVAHQVDMFLTTEYTLLELEYKQGKYVSPRLGTNFS